MKASDLPGELDSDFIVLNTRLSLLIESFIKLGEHKSRREFFDAFRELLQEKEAVGDEIAIQVLNWAYLELAEKLPID
jgi:hypothetical protein